MCKRLLLSIAFALVVAGNALAGGGLWQGNLGNGTAWDTAASWERGVPTLLPGDDTYITYTGSGETEGPVIDSSINAESYNLILGWDDGDVDGDDFLGWQAEFGSGEGSGSAAVPEPASLTLLFVVAAAASLWARRHARTKRG